MLADLILKKGTCSYFHYTINTYLPAAYKHYQEMNLITSKLNKTWIQYVHDMWPCYIIPTIYFQYTNQILGGVNVKEIHVYFGEGPIKTPG